MRSIKGTVVEDMKSLALFQVSLYAKMAMPDSQLYTWNQYLINNVEDIFDFLNLKSVYISL